MKNIVIAFAFLSAALAGQAQALSPVPPLNCSGANADSTECRIQEVCGDLQNTLADLIGERWAFEHDIREAESVLQTREQERVVRAMYRELGRIDRRIGRAQGRVQRCEARQQR